MINTNYVKFLRGTPTAYDKAKKDANTLYFIAEKDAAVGKLYLGNKLIAGSVGSDASSMIDRLGELTNVDTAGLKDKQLLGYDAAKDQWVPMSIENLITTSAGIIATVDDSHFSIEDGMLKLKSLSTRDVANLDKLLQDKVDAQAGYTLLSPEQQEKINKLQIQEDGSITSPVTIKAADVKNLDEWIVEHRDTVPGLVPTNSAAYIKSVSDDFVIVDGQLNLKSQPIGDEDSLLVLNTKVASLDKALNGDGTPENPGLIARIENIETCLTWTEMSD